MNAPNCAAISQLYWLKLDLDGHEGAPMAGVPYTLHFANGQQKKGTLDGNGTAEERNLPDTVAKVVYHNAETAKDEARPTVSDLLAKLDPLVSREPNLMSTPHDKRGK